MRVFCIQLASFSISSSVQAFISTLLDSTCIFQASLTALKACRSASSFSICQLVIFSSYFIESSLRSSHSIIIRIWSDEVGHSVSTHYSVNTLSTEIVRARFIINFSEIFFNQIAIFRLLFTIRSSDSIRFSNRTAFAWVVV